MIIKLSQKNSFVVKGFTLVEMLVVLGLFSFIMTLATGVLYTSQAINVKLQETQSILDNVSVSLEIMTRDIRYGSVFHCDTSLNVANFRERRGCSYDDLGVNNGGVVLFFKPVDANNSNDRVAYYASTTQTGKVILKDEYFSGKATTTYQITADDVKIKSLLFYVVGASSTSLAKDEGGVEIPDSNDYIQPLITLSVSGETIPIKEKASSTKFIVETSISSRVLDN